VEILKKYFAIQRDFQKLVIPNFDTLSDEEKVAYTKELLLHLVSETREVLDAVGIWKIHRKKISNSQQTQQILEELIDMFKYVLAIATIWGFTPEQFDDEFDRKTAVVMQRWYQEHVLSLTGKIAAVDLDGVLTTYPENWITYLRSKGYNITMENFSQRHEIVPPDEYEKLKFEFREDGHESLHSTPAPDASLFTQMLKSLGYKVVILSARPYTKHKRIFADTIRWLNRYNIPYDAVYFSDDKCLDIAKNLPQAIIIEDDPDEVRKLLRLNPTPKVFLLDKPYNRDVEAKGSIVRVKSLIDIIKEVCKWESSA
jgi:NTP pyrophosphatase (non-canonical NTP hydrolase)